MEYTYSNQPIKRTIIDIPATSKLLKNMRIQNGYSVKQLQEIFGFETPVAVYAWENEKCKNIPCIENFDVLSKLYKCHVEDLYVLKQVEISGLEVHETIPEYGTLANSWSTAGRGSRSCHTQPPVRCYYDPGSPST